MGDVSRPHLIGFAMPIKEPMLAVMAGGVLMGTGSGLILQSMGSTGGLDIIGIILNQKYSVRLGTLFFSFNLFLFAFSFSALEADLVLYSLFMSFIASQTMDYVLTFSNQRKMVIIITENTFNVLGRGFSRRKVY